MSFYSQISKYYDEIFPTGQQQLGFIKKAVGAPPARILDVACGSGGYSLALVQDGYRVTAVDLDPEMVRMAREKAILKNLPLEVYQLDMLALASALKPDYNCVFCIGNSLVHLGDTDKIGKVLSDMRSLIETGGRLVLQIINYDRILKNNIASLPTQENEKNALRFERNYRYLKGEGLVSFDTILTVNGPEGREEYSNSIKLFPLLSSDMEKLLRQAGFERFSFYGDFSGTPYNDDSYILVVEAEK